MQKPDTLTPQQQEKINRLIQKLSAPDPILDKLSSTTDIYCVGGAVRDALLGMEDADQDFVVVGSRPEEMAAAGFLPVGKDFPVFLHPNTHDEYALARTERKSGKGYKGFVFNADPTVRLEDDLSRRDLTVNAIALSRQGQLVDPYHGIQDLNARILRHVGPAFSEDPVRLLRLARFVARWPDFSIADATHALCQKMVAQGEAKALVAERVWQEIAKGLGEPKPSRMIALLMDCGAWAELHPAIHAVSIDTLHALDTAASQGLPQAALYALLVHNPNGSAQPENLFKAPKPCLELAGLLAAQSSNVAVLLKTLHEKSASHAVALLDWLLACDSVRRPDRFKVFLTCLEIENTITAPDTALLMELASWLSRPEANATAAQAAFASQKAGQPVEPAVRQARLTVLESHDWFAQQK